MYGAQSDAPYIQQKRYCLDLHGNTNFRTAKIELKIFPHVGPRNIPRNANTLVRLLSVIY